VTWHDLEYLSLSGVGIVAPTLKEKDEGYMKRKIWRQEELLMLRNV
jgi:hypothetical protein